MGQQNTFSVISVRSLTLLIFSFVWALCGLPLRRRGSMLQLLLFPPISDFSTPHFHCL